MFTWMLVEDELDIHDVILSMFEIWGVAGESFTEGPDAIQWINKIDQGRVERLPQLALVDIRLPTDSGIDVSARIRRSDYISQIPIVLMTAYHLSPQEEIDVMRRSGADELIYKPLPDMDELREIFYQVLDRNC